MPNARTIRTVAELIADGVSAYPPLRHNSCQYDGGAGSPSCRNYGARGRYNQYVTNPNTIDGIAWQASECSTCASIPATLPLDDPINQIPRLPRPNRQEVNPPMPLRASTGRTGSNNDWTTSNNATSTTSPPPAPPDNNTAEFRKALNTLAICADKIGTKETRAAYNLVELEFNQATNSINQVNAWQREHASEQRRRRDVERSLVNTRQQRDNYYNELAALPRHPIAIPANHIALRPPSAQQIYEWWRVAQNDINGDEYEQWTDAGSSIRSVFRRIATQLSNHITTQLNLPAQAPEAEPVELDEPERDDDIDTGEASDFAVDEGPEIPQPSDPYSATIPPSSVGGLQTLARHPSGLSICDAHNRSCGAYHDSSATGNLDRPYFNRPLCNHCQGIVNRRDENNLVQAARSSVPVGRLEPNTTGTITTNTTGAWWAPESTQRLR